MLPPLTELDPARLRPVHWPPDDELDIDVSGRLLRGAMVLLMNQIARDSCLVDPNQPNAAAFPDYCADRHCTEVYTFDNLKEDTSLTRDDWVSRWSVPERDDAMRTPANQQFYRDFFAQKFWDPKEGEGPDQEQRAVGYVVVVASKGEGDKIDLSHPGHLVVVFEEPTMDADVDVAEVGARDVWSIGFFPTGESAGLVSRTGVLQFPDPMFEEWVSDQNAMKAAAAHGNEPVRIVGAFRPKRADIDFFRKVVAGAQTQAAAVGDEPGVEYPTHFEVPDTNWSLLAGVMSTLQGGLKALGLQQPTYNCATFFAPRFNVDCPMGAPYLCTSQATNGFGDTFSQLLLSVEQQANDRVVKEQTHAANERLMQAYKSLQAQNRA